MSASIHRYQPDDPFALRDKRTDDWPGAFLEKCEELGFDIIIDPALRMRLWALWKDARSWE